MKMIDTEKLALFHDQLKKIASQCEENWYLVKRILNEMEMDDLYENSNVNLELTQALEKLEKMMDVFEGMKQMTATLSSDYQCMINRHHETLLQMSDYANGFQSTHQVLMDNTQRERAKVTYTSTAPIQQSLEATYGLMEVVEDE